ncbi:spermidine/putrescine ABC transporter substrate-binding protein [Bdellovibrio sp. HCB337]|uniref:polyamine ABC transporter substrate-binding protein n=1 Tax=Bdellovibrio sp. HCB337 TaxID=3394358 RepID=UPI0039A46702
MSRTLLILLSCLITTCGLLGACTKKNEAPTKKELNLSIWGNYLSPEIQEKFEKETGIKINVSNYSSNEELLAKVQMGSSGIDVAVPSDYMVQIMIKMNLLESLNSSQLTNKSLIAAEFLNQSYDPENKYSMPYTWTSTGIAYNKDLYKGKMKSWKDLLANKELKGKFALMDDSREAVGAALKIQGASINSTKEAELVKAKEVLLAAKKDIKMFTSDTIDILKNKEVVAAQAYSSDALQAGVQTGGSIAFILPEEGGTYAIDNFVIVKGAKHIDEAHKLINFLLSEEAEIAKIKTIMGGPIHKNIKAKLPKEIQENPVLFMTPESFKKLEHIQDLGESSKSFDDIWTEVKTK